MDTDSGDLVILVVANDAQAEKKAVVDGLIVGRVWEEYETAAGVRILSHKGSKTQVVDTLPLRNVEDKSTSKQAERWISQNSLRSVCVRKREIVVCVIAYAIVKEKCTARVFNNFTCWLDVLGHVWGDHDDLITVAITDANGLSSERQQQQLKNCLRRHKIRPNNVLFASFEGGQEERLVGALVESIRKMCPSFCAGDEESSTSLSQRGDSTDPRCCGKLRQSGPEHLGFSRCERVLSRVGSERVLLRKRHGPWSAERVILFGRTGSGKSTIAQMLTLGRLKVEQRGTKFEANSGIRGVTSVVATGEGRGWYVVDTPGFGEPESEESTVPTHVALHRLKSFVEWKEGTFAHYLLVMIKGRVDSQEVKLWKFFRQMFAVLKGNISHHLSIVICDADKSWLEENISHFQESFEGCSSFLTVNFPPTDEDKEVEAEFEEIRTESLRNLEEELARLGRVDLSCDFGQRSRMSVLNERDRGLQDEKVDKNGAAVVDVMEALGYLGENHLVFGFGLGFLSFFTSVDVALHYLTSMLSKDRLHLDL